MLNYLCYERTRGTRKEIKRDKRKKGLGLRETARLASVSYTLLSLVEIVKIKTTPTFLSKLAPVLSVPYVELLSLYGYYEVDKVDHRLHRLAKEFDAVLFEHLEEITSLGEGAKKTFCG